MRMSVISASERKKKEEKPDERGHRPEIAVLSEDDSCDKGDSRNTTNVPADDVVALK